METIRERFPELLPLVHLLYVRLGTVQHGWEDGIWWEITLLEGVNQRCSLSAIFAILVPDWVLQPLDKSLLCRAKARLDSVNIGDDGMGSITNLVVWIDDICDTVPLVDIKHICTTFCELSSPLLFDPNVFKTRILTSTNGESIIAHLA